MPKWVTVRDYAATYGVSIGTVREWIRAGRARAVKRPHGYLVLDPEALELANPESRVVADDFLPVMTPGDVAKMCRVSVRTISDWAKRGKIGKINIGRYRRYSANDVRLLLAYRMFCKKKRFSRKEKQAAIIDWAEKKLGLNQPDAENKTLENPFLTR